MHVILNLYLFSICSIFPFLPYIHFCSPSSIFYFSLRLRPPVPAAVKTETLKICAALAVLGTVLSALTPIAALALYRCPGRQVLLRFHLGSGAETERFGVSFQLLSCLATETHFDVGGRAPASVPALNRHTPCLSCYRLPHIRHGPAAC